MICLFFCLFVCLFVSFFFYLFFNFFLFINLFAPYLLELKMFMSTYSNWGVFFFLTNDFDAHNSTIAILYCKLVSGVTSIAFLTDRKSRMIDCVGDEWADKCCPLSMPCFRYFPWCSFNYETFAFQDHWHDLFVFLNGSKKKMAEIYRENFRVFFCAKIRQFSLIIKRNIQCVLNSWFDHSHFKVKWTIIDVSLMN